MKTKFVSYFLFLLVLTGCQNNYYSDADFLTITKFDAHMHVNTDRTIFEEQAQKDNFR